MNSTKNQNEDAKFVKDPWLRTLLCLIPCRRSQDSIFDMTTVESSGSAPKLQNLFEFGQMVTEEVSILHRCQTTLDKFVKDAEYAIHVQGMVQNRDLDRNQHPIL